MMEEGEWNIPAEEAGYDEKGRQENLLCLLTNLLLCYSLSVAVQCLYLTDPKRILAGAAVLSCFLLFEEWMEWARPGFVVYWGVHAAVLGGLLLAAQSGFGPVDGVTVAAALGMTGLWTWSRVREIRFCRPKWPLFLPGLAEFAAGYYTGISVLQRTGQVTILCAGILCIFWYSLSGIESALRATHTRASIPREQIRRNHRLVTGVSLVVFAAAAAAAAALSAGEALLTALQSMWKGFLQLLRIILGWLLGGLDQETVEETASEVQDTSPEWAMAGEAQDNPFLEAVTNLIFALILAAILFYAVRLIVRMLRNLYGEFNRTGRVDGDRVESLRPEEQAETARRRAASGRWFRARTPEERIRKWYRKAILAGGAGSIRESDTPRELEAASWGIQGETATEAASSGDGAAGNRGQRQTAASVVHTIYEKARYSSSGCTREEASAMKERLRQL